MPPSRSTTQRLVNKFETTGTVLDKKHSRTRMDLTEEKLDESGVNLELFYIFVYNSLLFLLKWFGVFKY